MGSYEIRPTMTSQTIGLGLMGADLLVMMLIQAQLIHTNHRKIAVRFIDENRYEKSLHKSVVPSWYTS